jgi:Lon protease-like protein
MGDLMELPLFPLNTVLFPGMVLPLHIFEPRYRLMIRRCIKLNDPFGVVLIRQGSEVGGGAIPYEVGTSAHITDVERLPEGRMNIQTVGYKRFRIERFVREKPFLVGMAADFPLEGADDPAAEELSDKLRPALSAFFGKLAAASDVKLPNDLPVDPVALAYLIAIALPLPVADRQALLTAPSLTDILRAEAALLRREMMLLDHMLDRPDPFGGMAFSPN